MPAAASGSELVDRQHAQYGFQHTCEIATVQAGEPLAGRLAREVCIDQGDVVAVPHRPQRVQQFRPEQRVQSDQHRSVSQREGISPSGVDAEDLCACSIGQGARSVGPKARRIGLRASPSIQG
jgi:hypothetical protein